MTTGVVTIDLTPYIIAVITLFGIGVIIWLVEKSYCRIRYERFLHKLALLSLKIQKDQVFSQGTRSNR